MTFKRRFQEEFGGLLEKVAADFGAKTRKKLQDWMGLHWASLRCAGRKRGQHLTSRGYEIDFNGQLADFCVEALNSSWISCRANLRKQLLEDLRLDLIPSLEKIVFQAKGQDQNRIQLIESTYQDLVEQAKQNLDLQLEKYDSEAEQFDALRPSLALQIRTFLHPTYEAIEAEFGKGSSVRMRNHLSEGVLSSTHNIGRLVKETVRQNWDGLTAAIEKRVSQVFEELQSGIEAQAESLEALAAHPSDDDEENAKQWLALEQEVETWDTKEAA